MCWAEPLHLLGGSALVRSNNRDGSIEVGTLGLEQIGVEGRARPRVCSHGNTLDLTLY